MLSHLLEHVVVLLLLLLAWLEILLWEGQLAWLEILLLLLLLA